MSGGNSARMVEEKHEEEEKSLFEAHAHKKGWVQTQTENDEIFWALWAVMKEDGVLKLYESPKSSVVEMELDLSHFKCTLDGSGAVLLKHTSDECNNLLFYTTEAGEWMKAIEKCVGQAKKMENSETCADIESTKPQTTPSTELGKDWRLKYVVNKDGTVTRQTSNVNLPQRRRRHGAPSQLRPRRDFGFEKRSSKALQQESFRWRKHRGTGAWNRSDSDSFVKQRQFENGPFERRRGRYDGDQAHGRVKRGNFKSRKENGNSDGVHFEKPQRERRGEGLNEWSFSGRGIGSKPWETKQRRPSAIVRKDLSGANVFVKHLPRWMTDKELRSMFWQYGAIASCKVKTEDGQSLGYGYVQFLEERDALRAIQLTNELGRSRNSNIRAELFRPRHKRQEMEERQRMPDLSSTNVYFENFPVDWRRMELALFVQMKMISYGKECEIRRVISGARGNGQTWACVDFSDVKTAKNCISLLNGWDLEGRQLRVTKAMNGRGTKFADCRTNKMRRVSVSLQFVDGSEVAFAVWDGKNKLIRSYEDFVALRARICDVFGGTIRVPRLCPPLSIDQLCSSSAVATHCEALSDFLAQILEHWDLVKDTQVKGFFRRHSRKH